MAIGAGDLRFTFLDGRTIPEASLHAVFGSGTVGGATTYALIELRNEHPALTLTAVKAWTSQGPGGATFAIALADTTARTGGQLWPNVDPATLTYSSATSKTAGLALPDLAPGYKALLALRRTLSGATAAHPEINRLLVGGASPI